MNFITGWVEVVDAGLHCTTVAIQASQFEIGPGLYLCNGKSLCWIFKVAPQVQE